MKSPSIVRAILALVGLGSVILASPSRAEIPLRGAHINSLSNQVDLLSPSGRIRPATLDTYFCTGDWLTTKAAAQAELLFNDGSLMRLGEQSQLSFLPQTRQLRLSRGTTLLFVPPTQGRMLIYTPNAVTGVQNNAVVVRYVPSSGLTLVMALADSETGTVSITSRMQPRQELTLPPGHMAFVKETIVQVIEFDLLEFYETSSLIAGLNPRTATFPGSNADSIAILRPDLLKAVEQQSPFSASSPVLDPSIIGIHDGTQGLFGVEADMFSPTTQPFLSEELRRYDDAPPGVVTPLPEMMPGESVETTEP